MSSIVLPFLCHLWSQFNGTHQRKSKPQCPCIVTYRTPVIYWQDPGTQRSCTFGLLILPRMLIAIWIWGILRLGWQFKLHCWWGWLWWERCHADVLGMPGLSVCQQSIALQWHQCSSFQLPLEAGSWSSPVATGCSLVNKLWRWPLSWVTWPSLHKLEIVPQKCTTSSCLGLITTRATSFCWKSLKYAIRYLREKQVGEMSNLQHANVIKCFKC